MSEFGDLFDRGIPKQVAEEFLADLQKLAVSMSWVHRGVTRGAKNAPTERLLEVAGRNTRGARDAAAEGSSDAVRKRLLVKNKTLDEALNRGPSKAASDIERLKEAVSAAWVANTARSGAQAASHSRLGEVAERSMKGVLGAVKKKGVLGQGAVDKRQALRDTVSGVQHSRVGSIPPKALQKAAQALRNGQSLTFEEKIAVATELMRLKQAADELAQEQASLEQPEAQVEGEGAVEVLPVEEEGAGASPEELVSWLCQVAAHEFKLHSWYTFYAEMVRGTDCGGLVELFEHHAEQEIEDAKYLLRRVSALAPGAAKLPVQPSPVAESDPAKVVGIMLAEEQRAIVLLTHLHKMCGEDPMRFTIEQMLTDEQGHADALQQYLAPVKQKAEAKLAAAMELARQQRGQEPTADQVVAQEARGQLQQAAAENQALRAELEQTQGAVLEHSQAAEQAAAENQMTQEQLAQTEQGAADAQMQAQQAMQEAQLGQQQAAQQADAKMRLAIRIQQTRQRLADMVAEDPVTEEGEQVDPLMTPGQQGMVDPNADPAAAAAMGQDPAAAAEQDPAAAAAGEDPAVVAQEAPAKPPAAKPKAPKASDPATKQAAMLLPGESEPAEDALLTGGRRVYSDARRSAATAHAVPGAALGAAAAHLTGKSRASGALLGAAMGGLHGRAAFNRNEGSKDIGVLRGLAKERLARADKANNVEAAVKKASADEFEFDLAYGL